MTPCSSHNSGRVVQTWTDLKFSHRNHWISPLRLRIKIWLKCHWKEQHFLHTNVPNHRCKKSLEVNIIQWTCFVKIKPCQKRWFLGTMEFWIWVQLLLWTLSHTLILSLLHLRWLPGFWWLFSLTMPNKSDNDQVQWLSLLLSHLLGLDLIFSYQTPCPQ